MSAGTGGDTALALQSFALQHPINLHNYACAALLHSKASQRRSKLSHYRSCTPAGRAVRFDFVRDLG